MHNARTPVTDKEKEWRYVKGQIITKFGTMTACAAAIGCATPSLRACILSDLLPGVRERLTAVLCETEKIAA